MGISLVAGRDFTNLEDAAAPPQAIVNEAFVRRFLDGAEPLGRRLESRSRIYTITGVVKDSISESFGERRTPVVYFSYRDRPAATGEMHLRTRAGAETLLAPELTRVVRDLDPLLPVYDVRTLTEHVEKNLFLRRIPARMFVVLGPLLLLLAAIGIYGSVAYTVSHRTTEIGLRMALGATATRVIVQILADTLRVIMVGVVCGWAVAFMVKLHLIPGPISLLVFAGVPLVLVLVATAACWVPARRAVLLDPMLALRED
jgi:ABC-type antimicrobial peptide transport system permease subunit